MFATISILRFLKRKYNIIIIEGRRMMDKKKDTQREPCAFGEGD